MQIYTIGFAGKSAERFFAMLSEAGVQKLIDIRRSNNTLYCGFTRARDLPYFLERLCGITYVHEPNFAPSLELLRHYQARVRANKRDPDAWPEFEQKFLAELAERPILNLFATHAETLDRVGLLCSEATADRCHRSLLAGHILAQADPPVEITHL